MRENFREKLPVILVAVFLCAAVGLTATLLGHASAQAGAVRASAEPSYDKTIVLDPGHGGPDGGAVGFDGTVEKGLNLAISLKLRSFLQASGFKVIMTREDDRTICDKGCKTIRSMKESDLHNRLKLSQKYPKALFVSIHQNIFQDSKYSGTQVFYSKVNPSSKLLAQSIQQNVRSLIQPQNTREIKPADKNLYIIYYSKTPTVMVECGFLSNPAECRSLESDAYQNKMAFSIYYGILKFYSNPTEEGKT